MVRFYSSCSKYIEEELGGWENIHLEYHNPSVLLRRKLTIVCADEEEIIGIDGNRNRWRITYDVGCDYSDCSGEDDPYGSIEVYRIVMKHTRRAARWMK